MPIDLRSLIPTKYLNHLEQIDSALKGEGFECYLVGGSVRDLVMGKTPKEYDLTTNAEPKQVKRLFRTVIDTGIEHGTVTVVLDRINYEITTYRIDKDYTDGRRPDHVEFGTTLSEDLKRRDFTMNALAFDISTGLLVDEHFGQKDIQERTIRTIGNPIQRFSEDGLRPIRALRFASTLDFVIEPETKKAIHETKQITKKISLERFQDEVLKSFLGPYPSRMIQLLVEENIFQIFLPNLPKLLSIKNHVLERLDKTSKDLIGLQLALAFFAILDDISIKEVESILRTLKFSGQNIKDCLLFFDFLTKWEKMESEAKENEFILKKEYLAPVKRHFQTRLPIDKELILKLEPIFGKTTLQILRIWEEKPPLLLTDMKLNGNHLAESYPELAKTKYGILLNQLLELVLRSPKENEYSRLLQHSAHFISNLIK
ncbi:poly-A polymerase [Leptospira sp. 2 VSF19]|uniref:Poly-A polymerase n=1 Tax=Leptospira soteropolitanensis TaxID=2950025 RepID=A0AAW5VSP6_9LEPT|nr:poly-A polymerase [Leptospira soteropolitanensis]MCW7494541.1 poly-A polymerase [Leptospira soteropolitanensis]MCW7502135.1 poly-A polymerase [Leptospira soteropolitanensis]MCW7524435.1 poly-A polymerase [Leptospira soteropolitanensis]MCW7528301.1 poly-A polymerase [Leptospira soteropolitanensis]MCW7532105.1 poly-A polymerase [Leptospira soteropolitanensis]